jgi:hypothetical protein
MDRYASNLSNAASKAVGAIAVTKTIGMGRI